MGMCFHHFLLKTWLDRNRNDLLKELFSFVEGPNGSLRFRYMNVILVLASPISCPRGPYIGPTVSVPRFPKVGFQFSVIWQQSLVQSLTYTLISFHLLQFGVKSLPLFDWRQVVGGNSPPLPWHW